MLENDLVKMRMLRWMNGNTSKGKLTNRNIPGELKVASIEDSLKENHLSEKKTWGTHTKRCAS